MAKNKKTSSKGKPQATFGQNIVHALEENPKAGMNYRQIAARLGMSDKASRELLHIFLEKLVADGTLTAMSRGKFKLSQQYLDQAASTGKIVSGTVDMKSNGNAFIRIGAGEEDVFVPAEHTAHALHGDTVQVKLFPGRRGQKAEGRVIQIVSRGKENYVGILNTSKYYGTFTADNANMPVEILIPSDKFAGAVKGDKVVVKITDWPEQSPNPQGEVVRKLGTPGLHEVEMQSIIVDYGFPLEFPAAVEKEARQLKAGIDEDEINRRRDFREVVTLTIDPEDAKDFDDALSLRQLPGDLWEVGVHIADVSHYVRPGTLLDQEAEERATSVYLVDRTIPMLPEALSNQLCSLNPTEDKLCFSAVFTMNDKAVITDEWYGKTVIHSNRRFNYDEAQRIIETGEGDYAAEILTLNRLATQLREERFRKGAIAFETDEVKFRLDELGRPVSAYVKEYKDSNKLIEDFMLLANRKVAETIQKYKKNDQNPVFVYRIHDVPNPEKLGQFNEFISKLGYQIKTSSGRETSRSFNQLFESIKGRGEENLISSLAIRTMAKAIYSTTNIGHYGLAFKYYTHFTSPIRRYPDLLVHRMLEAYQNRKARFDKTEYEHRCQHCSDMEKQATEAERASVKYKQAEYLLDKVGKEFEGLISGVSKWGLFVELDETKCEGLVALRDMNDDYYVLDEDNYLITGQSHGRQFRLGDRIRVKVKKIDMSKKTIDFALTR